MPFKASDDPQKWQELYLEKHARFDSLGKVGIILIPSLLIIAFSFVILILYISRILENQFLNPYLRFIIGGLLFLLPLLSTGFGINHLVKAASGFLAQFHNLSESEDISKITVLQILGRPALPPPLSNMIEFPEVTVKSGKLDPPNHWSSIIGGPVKLKIQNGNAVYIERGGKFSRIIGQGRAFLEWSERITSVVNVGPRYETFETIAWTKDGIKIKVELKGEYFLGKERVEGDENVLIPYDPESIRKAVEYIFKNGKNADEWLKSAVGHTQGILGSTISKKYLDELFIESRHEYTLLSTNNMHELVSNINSKLQEYGVMLSSLQITDIDMSPYIKRERLKTWEVERKNLFTIATGEVKAYQIRIREKARAEMQRDLIVSIANSLENIDATNFPEPLLLTLSNYLDHSLDSPQVRANIAKESLELLEKMQEILKFPLWMSAEEAMKNTTEDISNERRDHRNSKDAPN